MTGAELKRAYGIWKQESEIKQLVALIRLRLAALVNESLILQR
jgi:hypothetical protein